MTNPLTTVFTCSIYPDLTRVWYHFARRYAAAPEFTTLIYDCGSRLESEDFAGARLLRHRNLEHGRKIDHCIKRNIKTETVFLTDDDAFLLHPQAAMQAIELLRTDPQRAVYSYKPRDWWNFEIDGKSYPVMGSYALFFKPDIVRREKLSFRTQRTTDPKIRRGEGYYDTGDYLNEQLIRRGYEILTADKETRGHLRSYSAVSSGFVNFARRGWFTRKYYLTQTREVWADKIRRHAPTLERACGVAATIVLYRTLFDSEPLFTDFFTYSDLHSLAAEADTPEKRKTAQEMVRGYENLLKTLLAAA